ncbi:MAG: AsnC family transcriptional regulator [Pseudomonadota bacterium]
MSDPKPDHLDKLILTALQGDLGDSLQPYRDIAEELGTTEEKVIGRIRRMQAEGIIRRMGAMIRHIDAGMEFNGMVVWAVKPEQMQEVGHTLAAFPEVTHCYERPPFGKHGGTLFTMIHAASEDGCMEIVRRMAETAKIDKYEILFSERELKKISMTYFGDGD